MFGLQMFNQMDDLHKEMDQLFRGFGFQPAYGEHRQAGGLKFADQGDHYLVTAVVPGIDPEKLDISVLGRQLTLAGEYATPELPDGVTWHRRERPSGRFSRTLRLPDNLEAEQIEAEYGQGLLTVKLPKAASAMPKKIDVKVA